MTPDLDTLTALLAEHRRDHNGNYCWCPCLNALPSLIEAARREAGLVEALSVVEGLIAIRENDRLSGDDCYEQTEDMPIFAREAWNAAYDLIEARDRAMTTARALLHDNAGVAARAALPAEGTE